jgi:peptidoglycan biosynthesis protein MviN/MurJ (putative lipid II flippase)
VGPIGAILAVALGYTASRWLKSLVLVIVLKWSVPMFPWRETASFTLRLLLVAVLAGLATWAAQRGLDRVLADGMAAAKAELATAAAGTMSVQASVKHSLLAVKLAVAGLAGGLALLGGAWLLRVREPFEMIDWTVQKLRGRFKAPANSPAGVGSGSGD